MSGLPWWLSGQLPPGARSAPDDLVDWPEVECTEPDVIDVTVFCDGEEVFIAIAVPEFLSVTLQELGNSPE